jgi:hypothetical protein
MKHPTKSLAPGPFDQGAVSSLRSRFRGGPA